MLFGFSIWVILIAAAIVALISFIYDIEWYKIAIVVIAILFVSGLYRDGKLPEKLEPIADKLFFWVDNDANAVDKSEKTEEATKVVSYKKKITLINKDGILGIRWKVIITFAVLAFIASRTLDLEWYIPACIAAVIVLSSALYRNNLLPNFVEPLASRLFTWTYNLDIDEPYRPAYNRGTCYDLSGSVTVLCLHVNDDESSWTAEDVKKFDENVIFPGIEFVNEQAALWGVDLNMTPGRYGKSGGEDDGEVATVHYDGIIPTLLDGGHTDRDGIIDNMAKMLGFSSTEKFYEYTQRITGTDQVVIMVLVNKDGRSHAGVDTIDDDGNQIESYVVYTSLNGNKTRSGTVAHELLHAFGAEDLYEEGSTGERATRAAIAKKYWPNDIMLIGGWRGTEIVDAYTAYAVGWTDKVPEVCTSEEFWEGHWSRE